VASNPPPTDEEIVAEWLKMREFFDETYPWDKKTRTPTAEELRILIRCTADIHNTSCYQEGTCCNRSAKGCAYKEK